MKKKIKLVLKIIIIVLVVYLLCFVGYFGNKLVHYQKLSMARKVVLGSESYKIVLIEEPYSDYYASNVRTGMKKGNKTAITWETKYSTKAKDEQPFYSQDSSSTRYYLKDENSSSQYKSHEITVDNINKTFFVMESGIFADSMVEGLYPQAVDFHFIGGTETLEQKYWYLTAILPMINKMKFYTTDDNGIKAFVSEEDRTSYSGEEDREFSRIRTYFDKDTMIAYKQTKVKPDGIEKLVSTIEVTLNSVTDEEVSVPDLSTYRQFFVD